MRPLALLGWVVVGGLAAPLDAQRVEDSRQAATRHDTEARTRQAQTAVYIRSGTQASTRSMVIGGIVGEAIGVPVGVNWVTNSRGKLARTVPISLGLVGGCILAGGVLGIPAILPLQLYTSINTERRPW